MKTTVVTSSSPTMGSRPPTKINSWWRNDELFAIDGVGPCFSRRCCPDPVIVMVQLAREEESDTATLAARGSTAMSAGKSSPSSRVTVSTVRSVGSCPNSTQLTERLPGSCRYNRTETRGTQ